MNNLYYYVNNPLSSIYFWFINTPNDVIYWVHCPKERSYLKMTDLKDSPLVLTYE